MTPTQKQIREEFREKFPEIGHKHDENCEWKCHFRDDIVNWWLSKLKSHDEELLKGVEELESRGILFNCTDTVSRAEVRNIINSQKYE